MMSQTNSLVTAPWGHFQITIEKKINFCKKIKKSRYKIHEIKNK